VTLGNDNGTDGQTDRVRRIMRPPPREEGRIITFSVKINKILVPVNKKVDFLNKITQT